MSHKKGQYARILTTVFFILTFFSFTHVFAQSAPENGQLLLTTSPLPINLKVTPGTSISTPIKIKNDGNQDENLKVTLMKFKADPTTGATILSEREPADTYFNWVSFSDPNFTLKPNEWKTVTATFNVPANASFDYYYAIVFFRADQKVEPGNRQTVLNGGTATMVLLTADVPNAKKELTLDQFTVNKNIFEFLPATFNIKIKNSGNVHVVPHGNIFISKDGQKDIAILDVNATQGSILPDSPRIFQSNWSDAFPVYIPKLDNGINVKDDAGNIIQELKWNWADASKLRWGKYTANLVLVYDNGTRDVPIEATVSFWVLPFRLIGGGALIMFFVLIGLKSALQNWYRKIKNLFSKNK